MVLGRERLHAQINRMPEKIIAAVSDVMEAEAEALVRQMRSVVPVDDGELRASINWKWGGAPKGAVAIATFKGRDYGRLFITIYAGKTANSFHGRFQEFGTSNMPANPFFYPTFRANRSRIRAAISRAVRKGAAG